ncbi:MAG TPA: hypothetical protein VGV41_17940 [Pseudolabrys sp.]|uniref:hypothetical protein n=1 Tax=Pseudolabrys sp. TaxID=1960880 RepID=UPI002DDD593A|nr:hypothetical protein [Pseudolabrys sp.]HEV2630513.1 hypothetical protein [Pseudolabrys sp.]
MRESFPRMNAMKAFLDVARTCDATMSVGALSTFLYVAVYVPELASGRMSVQDLSRAMAVPYTSLARHIDLLSNGVPGRVRGLGLLERGALATNRRQNQIVLTEKGMELLARLAAAFNSSSDDPEFEEILPEVSPPRPISLGMIPSSYGKPGKNRKTEKPRNRETRKQGNREREKEGN